MIIKIKTLSEFKIIRLSDERIMVINQKGMSIFDKDREIINKNFNFTFNGSDINNISFFINTFYVFFLLKNNLCIFFDESKELKCKNLYQNNDYKFCQITIIEDFHHNSYILYSSFFFSFQCINSLNEIVFEIYQFNLDNEILFYNIGNKYFFKLPNESIINGFSCESMHDQREKRLTCFLGYINNIVSYSFNIDDASNIINNSSKIFSNNGAISLKTISSKKYVYILDNWYDIKYESIICFIDYNSEDCNCIRYNFQTNSFSEYIINNSLNNCKLTSSNLFNIEKIEPHFFLYCFHTSTEFSLIKLELNPYEKDFSRYKDYKISNSLIKNDTNYFISVLIYHGTNIYISFYLGETLYYMKPQEEIPNTNLDFNSIYYVSDLYDYAIDQIINKTKFGESYYFHYGLYSINVYPINNNSIGQTKTNIELLKCEKKLRDYYNLNDNNLLVIVQLEIFSNSIQTLSNNVKYAIYDENKKKLNLSVCDGVKVRINYEIKDKKLLKDYIFYHSKYNIDIYNINDPFFNDICLPFLDPYSGEFMTLKDRIEKIYMNLSKCENNCEYDRINDQDNTISCICFSIPNIESKIEAPKFQQKELTYLQYSDYGILKCYNLFNKKMFKTYSFWISIASLIIRFLCYFNFFKCGIKTKKNYVEKEMKKYHYDIEENEVKKEIRSNSKKNINLNSERIIIKKAATFQKNKPKKKNDIVKYHRPLDNDEDKKDDNKICNSQINYFNSENIEIKKKDERNREVKNEFNINENTNYNRKEIYNLISLDANNTSENRESKDSVYVLDNYYYDLALKYEKRSCFRIYIIYLMNTDLSYIFCFNSSLYLKSLRIVLFLRYINDDIIINALLHYDEDRKNSSLYFILNDVVIPFISMILSSILSFFYDKLINYKDDLMDLFIEEEKKMRSNRLYKIEKRKKIEIKIKINQILKCLEKKVIIFFIIDILFWIFSFYYLVIFYFVYYKDKSYFINKVIISLCGTSSAILPYKALVLAILYKVSLKYKCKYLYNITLFFY